MLEVTNEYTAGFMNAMRGMRYPMRSESQTDTIGSVVGVKDQKLAKHLAVCGDDHGKALRQICVWCDIDAPLYWWKEMDTYKIGTVASSESTMHKLMAEEFGEEDFETDGMLPSGMAMLMDIIDELNWHRDKYLDLLRNGKKEDARAHWLACVKLLPSCYKQKRCWSANYQVLRHIYHARKNHKLQEWHDFCDWIKGLPYAELITTE